MGSHRLFRGYLTGSDQRGNSELMPDEWNEEPKGRHE